jgi:hypothetical protein
MLFVPEIKQKRRRATTTATMMTTTTTTIMMTTMMIKIMNQTASQLVLQLSRKHLKLQEEHW